MTIYDRLNQYLIYKNISVSGFEHMCGLSNGAMSKFTDNTRRSTFGKIANAFPDLNIEWVKTGKGDMLKDVNQVDDFLQNGDDNIVSEPNEEYDCKKIDKDHTILLPVEAMAGSLQGFSEGVALKDCRKVKSPVEGADWAIQISGDSMEPEYRNGSYLYIKKMSGSFIPWGHTLVIDTIDGVVVKNIFPIDGTDEFIEARSINTKYPSFKIETSCILGMYRVLGGSFINSTI